MDFGIGRVRYAAMEPSAFVDDLAAATFGRAFNFYRDGDGAQRRRSRLLAYLERRSGARFLLVGEAPGYRGARVSGIPFTSERQLTGTGPAEATATIVHRVLGELELESEVLLWNVLPAHPHREGEPASNRPPSKDEVEAGLAVRRDARGGSSCDRRRAGCRAVHSALLRSGIRRTAERRLFAGGCYNPRSADALSATFL